MRTKSFQWHFERDYWVGTDFVMLILILASILAIAAYFVLPLANRRLTLGFWILRIATVSPDGSVLALPLRRVSTPLRQVLAKFNEFFICWVFRKEISRPGLPSNDDRQRCRPTASPLFFLHVPPPIATDSAVAAGLLIQTALGRTGGLGALRTKRSG